MSYGKPYTTVHVGKIERYFECLCRVIRAALLTGGVFSVVSGSVQAARPARLLAGFEQATTVIETSGIFCLLLDIYLTNTPDQRAQGLMYIEQIDEFEAMLFSYPVPAGINMWMKNTYISLDMLFIRQDGTIAGIAKNTTPLSTQRISSPEPVTMVLEVNAGFTDKWRIESGNRLLSIN